MNDKKPVTSLQNSGDSVRILPPSYALKEKIGMNVNLHEIFTPERIAAAQKAIDDTQAEFVVWATKYMAELEDAYRGMAADLGSASTQIEEIRKIAFSLKSQAGTFGYPLGSEVAKSLYKFLGQKRKYNTDNLVVVRKHIDALQVILQQNIQGEGGVMGNELMDNLKKLVAKFG